MKIVATGSSVPKMELTNEMLSQMMDTNDEWIRTRTGIRSRRVLSSETITDLAIDAAKKCLGQSSLQPIDIDYILCHNIVNNVITPSLASIINKEIGTTCPTLDLNSACTGFIYALDVADSLLKAEKAHNVLIVCAEQMSHFIDWNKRETCVLFGDAAGAVIVENGGDDCYFHLSTHYTDALHCNSTYVSTPFHPSEALYPYLEMRGKDVFKLAILNSCNDIKNVINNAGLKPKDINYYLLHQANIRILEAIREELELPEQSVPHNIEKRGNTSSASIPLLMDELNRSHTFMNGDLLLLSAFGAGFTSGACLIKWQC
ncbi:MAG: beta-ketoacyl-ACP synthase 3 [Paludibacteraceae bacterium]|nr:beta-ketoacyl-ACP synthase 3 [Paludibacteraceae bacterium]